MKIDVLDHGYVRLVETWGRGDAGEPEAGIVEAARQSTQGAFRGWGGENRPGDEKLLAYLYNSKPPHSTPFEFAGMIVEVRAPIFVFREWQRHRTQFYNEMSARYAPLPDLNYVPTVERMLLGGGHLTKQAAAIDGAPVYDADEAQRTRDNIQIVYGLAQETYDAALKAGCPKELARLVLPVGRYSQMRAGASLRNWLAFLTLRADPKAQWEIQQYALAVAAIVEREFPQVHKLYATEK